MGLQDYRRKRRFDRTPEPAADPARAPAGRPVFVVQLHHARHRHYDFRLQVGDTLRSWAVPKGPSFDPAVKRLAAEVEDHPVAYADFEGEIPKGEYGGGHVAMFDRGLWTTDGDPEAQLAKGHLRFHLFGDKLKGGWHLVRTQKGGRQPQWLLFKDQDAFAAHREADDLLQDVAPPPGTAMRTRVRKASRKTTPSVAAPRWARRAAKLDGARVGHDRPTFRAPQLARLHAQVPHGKDWLHEAKWDGYRLITVVSRGKVRLWSRNQREWTAKAPEIVAALESLALSDAVLDGELIAGTGRQEDFGLLQATLSGEKHAPLSYVLFDILQVDGVDVSNSPQYQRKALLSEILRDPPARLAYSSHVLGKGEEALAMAVEQGLEGIIAKRADAPYHSGRGDTWRKIKQRDADEFAVVGFTLPKGTREGLGALLLAMPDAQHGWRYAGRVGSGFSHELLTRLGRQLSRSARSRPTVYLDVNDPELDKARWVPPRLVAEVFHHGRGNQGLLRQPVLKVIRRDKVAEELLGSTPARPPRARVSRRRSRTVPMASPVVLSSPDRVVYPDSGATKAQVFDYYRTIAPWLLPEIVGRPMSVVRCPQGLARPCFFQKHEMAGMQHASSITLTDEGGTKGQYLLVNDTSGLLELVQFNALEFHPWGSRAEAPDRADGIVFDLDPGPGVTWQQVVAAARQVRDRLRALGLESHVRTSGGKGLHVFVPLRPPCMWPQVKAFAKAFADAMATAQPAVFVATAAKRARVNRIYIDYLRNGRGATSVASFSLRARAGAPVAMPLRWSELGRVKSSDAYGMQTALRRMARMAGHPWGEYRQQRQGLEEVLARLSGTRPRAGT